MTRKEVYNWIIKQNCQQEPLSDQTTVFCILFINPKTKRTATLNTPIDNREMLIATISQICYQLGIEIPPEITK